MHKNSPSINIIRDAETKFDYLVTSNTQKVNEKIFQNFEKGIHCFNLIGSFGTGKSSFLLALENSLLNRNTYFLTPFNGNCDVLNILGDYHSLSEALNEEFGISEDHEGNQKLFNAIYERYERISKKNGLLLIVIDEFGKFLEYAAQNNPEKEIYFLQKLAEFINEPNRNILLLTSVHQSVEAYGHNLNKVVFQEWKKVKGRFIDIAFNEPVEHLLLLASKKINSKNHHLSVNEGELVKEFNLFAVDQEITKEISSGIFPLGLISGFILSRALQEYGQNERSLFTFLNSAFFESHQNKGNLIDLSKIYDYIYEEFYSYLNNRINTDFSNWTAIKSALERKDGIHDINNLLAEKLLKTLGLLTIFTKKGASLNEQFFVKYFNKASEKQDILDTIEKLEKNKILRYSKFDYSYKFTEGTDLDIDNAISKAANRIESVDVLQKLNSHFQFPVIIAKAVTYNTGTPRLFRFVLTNGPINDTAKGQIDGFVNLIFNEKGIDEDAVLNLSRNSSTLYGYFKNTKDIFETLLEIEKTNAVLKEMQDENDRVAIKELRSIIRSNQNLLNHYVMDCLYSGKVDWFSNGVRVEIHSKQAFNHCLSQICENIYPSTPLLHNELINRHKVSGSISSARRNFWRALTDNENKEDLGFPETKWPAEKTIYYSLLKSTGMHRKIDNRWQLAEPDREDFIPLWELSNEFLNEARIARRSLVDFHSILESAPIKLKKGVIDFWLPTFLYMKRGDFALYNENGFVPFLDETVLYSLTRNLKEYSIKSFELNNLRLNLFNKYRDLLNQENTNKLRTETFIESIRPLLVFYRDLPDYNKKTKTISKEAIQLREAISKAKDPEKTFFEDFPQALGYSLNELGRDEKLFEEYVYDFQNKIQEIKQAFDEYLNRLELFICDEIIGERIAFELYQKRLQNRFSSVKEHKALTRHKVFLLRVNSNFPDRNSYLMALGQALLGSRMDSHKDSDEDVLKDKFRIIVTELDNLVDINNAETTSGEKVVKFEVTTSDWGSKNKVVRITKKQQQELTKVKEEVEIFLNKYKNLKLPILLQLLEKDLEDNE